MSRVCYDFKTKVTPQYFSGATHYSNRLCLWFQMAQFIKDNNIAEFTVRECHLDFFIFPLNLFSVVSETARAIRVPEQVPLLWPGTEIHSAHELLFLIPIFLHPGPLNMSKAIHKVYKSSFVASEGRCTRWLKELP